MIKHKYKNDMYVYVPFFVCLTKNRNYTTNHQIKVVLTTFQRRFLIVVEVQQFVYHFGWAATVAETHFISCHVCHIRTEH